MNKILAVMLLAVCFVVPCFAENPTAVNEYTFTINNNAATAKATILSFGNDGEALEAGVSKITAYAIMEYPRRNGGLAAERLIAVYDSSTLSAASELVGEKEVSSGSEGERFFRPRKILNGVWVYQGAYTTAVISFIRE